MGPRLGEAAGEMGQQPHSRAGPQLGHRDEHRGWVRLGSLKLKDEEPVVRQSGQWHSRQWDRHRQRPCGRTQLGLFEGQK